jgi:hypothetical protein
MQALMEESVSALAGPKGKHNPDRVAVRHGHEQGSVTLGDGGGRCSGLGSAQLTAPVSCR